MGESPRILVSVILGRYGFYKQHGDLMAYEDIKWELLDTKKRFQSVFSENNILKVKIRKLQNEICKKDKQITSLLDPKKSTNIAKIVSERGASMVLNLTEKNNELQNLISVKDGQIKKLEAEKVLSQTYAPKDKPFSKKFEYRSPYKMEKDNKFRSRSLFITPEQLDKKSFKSSSEIQLESDYQQLLRNLDKIRNSSRNSEDIKQFSPSPIPSIRYTPSEENDKMLQCEITQLKTSITNMSEEMNEMKKIILELSEDQDNTKKILKNKNKNIEILSKQIKLLNKNKSRAQKPMSNTNINHSYSSIDSENKDTHSLDSCEEELFKNQENTNILKLKCSVIDYFHQLNNQKYVDTDLKPPQQNSKILEEDDDNDVETG